jgi:hypothetical protein
MKKDTTNTEEKLDYNPNITKEDKELLGEDKDNIHNDGSADRELINRNKKVDFTGKDLDIPGRTAAHKNSGTTGLNDEENKLHSQGGERNNNLERDDSSQ